MRSLSRTLARAGCAAAVLLATWGSASAQTANTASNTAINNTATLSYSVNGTNQASICSKPGGNTTPGACTAANNTTFRVDTKVNLNVVTKDTQAQATTPGANGTMTFTVTNLGNATQDFNLTAVTNVANAQAVFTAPNVATDTFDTGTCTIYNSTGTTSITKLSSVPASPAAGSSVDVLVVCPIDTLRGGTAAYSTTTPADYALVGLRATATPLGSITPMAEATRVDDTTPGVVLADGIGTDDLNSVTPSRDASFSARSALKATPAALNVKKAVATLCDPFNGNTNQKAIPGAYVRYTITIANASTAPASAILTAINDAIGTTSAGTLTADPDLILGTSAATCVAATTAAQTENGTATGKGVQVRWSGVATRPSWGGASGTKYLTSAPTTYTSTALSITSTDWQSLLPVEGTSPNDYKAGELKPGEQVDVIFNAVIK